MSAAASRARTADRRYYGVVEALVVEVFDDADEARVRIKFPWFDDAMVSEWCRVAQPYAGDGYGFVFVPEQGDEVLVAFVQGDMRMPIVIGGLYNGVDKPPTARKRDRDQKLIRTKAGHEVLLDDTAGSEAVQVRTTGGHTVDLDDSGKKVTVASSGGHRVVMDDSAGKVTVETAGGQSVELDAAGGSVTVTGATIKLSGSQISLGSAAAQSLVLGDAFMTLFNAHVHTSTAPGVPTSPPVTPMLPVMLSTTSKTQ